MLGIIGLIFVIVAPILVYRTAKQNGHNAGLWTLAALGVGFGLQFVIPFTIGIVVYVVYASRGLTDEEIYDKVSGIGNVFSLLFLILSIVGVFLVLRRVSTVAENRSFEAPPPPPDFNQPQ